MGNHNIVKEWLEIACEDYEAASYLYGKEQRKPLEIVCYQRL